jgi:hypothetical protein
VVARVVCVHGIGQQALGEQSLLADWYPALVDGLTRSKAEPVSVTEVAMGFYGDLYRLRASTLLRFPAAG